jgi:hypothetical protein
LSKVTKGNNCVEKSILVGMGRPGGYYVDGALNNYRLFSLSDCQLSNSFGFTGSDIQNIEKTMKLNALEIENINVWYGGYHFGESTLYNPASVLKYLADIAKHRTIEAKKHNLDVSQYIETIFYTSPLPKPYWDINLKDSYLIDIILCEKIKPSLNGLFNKQILTISFTETATYYAGIEKSGNIYELLSILVNAGILTLGDKDDKGQYVVRIPNKEVSILLQSLWQQKPNLYTFFKENKLEKPFSSLTVTEKRLYLLKAMQNLIYDNKELLSLIGGMVSEEQKLDTAYELLQEQNLAKSVAFF